MLRAKGQAEGYIRDLPADEPSPPFLIVCDIGFCFDLYADFSGTGRHYAQFPDRERFRVYLTDLADPEKRATLAAIWRDPRSLDPSRERVEVTRHIAAFLARLARELERRHTADAVATFLMRCIFCMFAQSVGLLPGEHPFTALLRRCQARPETFVGLVGDLWRSMNAGGFCAALADTLRRFNGGLYAPGPHGPVEPLPLAADEIDLLVKAASRNWADVEPGIFGTLLENALDPRQRGQLGAHFTPRAFVERLVLPTVMEPLRAEWDSYKATADLKLKSGDQDAAAAVLREFHARLCTIRVLDPACGTGNFLYVTMELMKRLEGEVLDLLANVVPGEGDRLALAGASVDPHQFLGLEKNPRAVPVAELVLWIGWLQWHFRTSGDVPPAEPILRDFHNIQEADALLQYAREEPDRDRNGVPMTRWGGRTKPHPITGEEVPDEADRVLVLRPMKAKPTEWPEADFIVGNPPFIGAKYMRELLGDGYSEALWSTYPEVPKSADLALHFWWKAARLASMRKARRFGFITSNSIRQIFCRRVVADELAARKPLRLVFAIPDHPWSDGRGAAAVRIAMTVGEAGRKSRAEPGVLKRVVAESIGVDGTPNVSLDGHQGVINADLTIGTSVDDAQSLRSNQGLASPGVKLHGSGFIVSPGTAYALGRDTTPTTDLHIRRYLHGRDVTQRSRGLMVVDLFGLTESEVRARLPAIYQHILLHVKPERDSNSRVTYRKRWWLFGEPRAELRPALRSLTRYIATPVTSKHRMFVFVPIDVLPDDALICIATDDALHLGILSSRIHVAWALAAGGTLEDRPRYNKTRCFDPFPFPAATPAQEAQIRTLAEELDAHRRTRLDAHPQLTMTGLYNVLDKLRAGTALGPAERDIHDAGQVSIMRHLHDELDAAVAAAYGWPRDLAAAEIVARLVALNRERQEEEANGVVRWLRPEYQAPTEARRPTQAAFGVTAPEAAAQAPAWPAREPDRFVALRAMLAATPLLPEDLARRFRRARTDTVQDMLETLAALGQARRTPDGRYHS